MSQSVNVGDLFGRAHAEGTLSRESVEALTNVDLGAQIQAGLGIAIDDVSASEVVLVTMMPDDSGSIESAGNVRAVCEGHNMVLDALAGSRQREEVLAHTRYLNGHVFFPYVPLGQTLRMDPHTFRADGGTPLYDQTVVLLGTALAKAQAFAEAGVPARTVTLLITDGSDQCSRRSRAKSVASLVRDLTAQESHIVAAMGVSDGSTDFRRVFREMGIDARWVLTPGNSEAEIRQAFRVFSRSAVRLSQAARGRTSALGGFGN
jgi:hypothetical protein